MLVFNGSAPSQGSGLQPPLVYWGSQSCGQGIQRCQTTCICQSRVRSSDLSCTTRRETQELALLPGIFHPTAPLGRSPPSSPPHPWSGQGGDAVGFSCKGPRPVPRSMDSAPRGSPFRPRLAGDPSPSPPCQMSQLNSKKPRSPEGPIPVSGKMPPCHPVTGAS